MPVADAAARALHALCMEKSSSTVAMLKSAANAILRQVSALEVDRSPAKQRAADGLVPLDLSENLPF